MKKDIRNKIDRVVDGAISDYNGSMLIEDRSATLKNVVNIVNAAKELESSEIENQVKKKRLKLDEEKTKLEKDKIELERDKLMIEQQKIDVEKDKLIVTKNNENQKLILEETKIELEKLKFEYEKNKVKSDKLYNGVIKGLEIGLPLIFYTGLSVLSLKAIYKDDVRVPSETWNFIRSVSKK